MFSLPVSGPCSDGHSSLEGTNPATSSYLDKSLLSPSTTGTVEPSLSAEAAVLFSNLDNYLPLGCYCFEDFLELGEQEGSNCWQDLKHLPSVTLDGTLYTDLQRLAAAYWLRIQVRRSTLDARFVILRLYVLPFDIGLRFIDRSNRKLVSALQNVISEMDVSARTWEGEYMPSEKRVKFDAWATCEEGSLYWMFNRLPSPAPSVRNVQDRYAREALEDLLDPALLPSGLKTQLYPYQRRSAGLMLERECSSRLQLDPRLELRTAPDGSSFYFGPRDLTFLRDSRYYESCKGGILSESMGLGKTLICLALILATKNHPPLTPPQYNLTPVRANVASLAEMAVATLNRNSVPVFVELERIQHASSNSMDSCRRKLRQDPPGYEKPMQPVRWNRNTILPPPRRMTMAATTVIVVPRNLYTQWQSEMRKHVDDDSLRVLFMEDPKKVLPSIDELRNYDVILFTRNRFELEIKDGSDAQGRRLGSTRYDCRCPYIGNTRVRDCHCVQTDDLYDSPLKYMHFKRLIVDEGHFFSNRNTVAASVASELLTVDHRWIVSGTPAKDLLGVEVDMSVANLWNTRTPKTKQSRQTVMEQRRHFNRKEDTQGAIKNLGALATHFLRLKPWAADRTETRADWEETIYRHEDYRRRTWSGYSRSLSRTLQSLVIKTQPEDVERDIELPPLSHKVVRLDASFYDKLTANLFTLVLTANAVTSERTDVDYLFHHKSRQARSQLISNLRQSAFCWTGFSEADVLASIERSHAYLAKEDTQCSDADRKLLAETLTCVDSILASDGWKAMSRSNEIGLFVKDWPIETAEHWAFQHSPGVLMTGISPLIEAQKYVNERAHQEDPAEGLAGLGVRALAPARYGLAKQETDSASQVQGAKSVLSKSGIPVSSLDGEPVLKRRNSLTKNRSRGQQKKVTESFKVTKEQRRASKVKKEPTCSGANVETTPALVHKEEHQAARAPVSLPESSPFLASRIVGTSSAKMSYLMSQILRYQEQEKILVFYDGENVAYYIAQALELLHIKHEIYAKSLPAHLKSEYVVRFDQGEQDRVLVMDVTHAAFGLNLASASRIYFVNPVCRPHIEAQAIKRAHRIGQTRKVFVETLVLKDSIEEKMLERSKRMSRTEHHEAKALEDDGGIREIIQSAKILPVAANETDQMASLEEPQQLWCRPGWQEFSRISSSRSENVAKRKAGEMSVAGKPNEAEAVTEPRNKKRRHVLSFVDCVGEGNAVVTREDSDNEDASLLTSANRRSLLSEHDPFMSPSVHGYQDSTLHTSPPPMIDDHGNGGGLGIMAHRPCGTPEARHETPCISRMSGETSESVRHREQWVSM